MNKGFAFVLGLIFGGAGGGFLANLMLKQKYEQKADDQIAACRNAFLDEMQKRRDEEKKAEKETNDKQEKAVEAAKTYGAKPEEVKEVLSGKKPYPISISVYEDPSNPYKAVSFKYYPKDGILLDEENVTMTIDSLVDTIGRDALTHFGEYDEDRVIMRNEDKGIDYEIIKFDGHYKSE